MNLLEILIALFILAILTVMAEPIYQQWIIRSHRSSAIISLLQIANELTIYHAKNASYLGANLTDLGHSATTADGSYTVSIVELKEHGYLLSAQPIGQQIADLECKGYLLDHTGARQVTGSSPLQYCWP